MGYTNWFAFAACPLTTASKISKESLKESKENRVGVLKKLIASSSWLLGSSTIKTVLGAIQGILIARLLGVEQFGVFILITSFTAAINQFVDSRVWETVVKFVTRFRSEDQNDKATAVLRLCLIVDILTAIVGVVIIMCAADWAAKVLIKDGRTSVYIRIFSVSLLVAAPSGASTAVLRIANRFSWLALRESSIAIFRFVSVIGVLVAGLGVFGLVITYVCIAIVDSVVVVVLVQRVYADLNLGSLRKSPISLIRDEFREIIRFLFMSNGIAFTKMIQHHLGAVLTGAWLGPIAVGYLKVAKRLCELMMFPIAPLAVTTYPEFVRLWHDRKLVDLKDVFWNLTGFLFFGALLLLFVMLSAAHMIIPWTVGVQYLPALPLVYWLVFGTVLQVVFLCFPLMLRAVGKMGNALVANVASVAVYVITLLILLPSFGVIGAAMAQVALTVVWAIVSTYYVRMLFHNELKLPDENNAVSADLTSEGEF